MFNPDATKLITPFNKFNTGRLYSAEGQPIVWAVVERADGTRAVPFIDYARGIESVIEVPATFTATDILNRIGNAWVLDAYSAHRYSWGKHGDVQALKNAIKASEA